MKKDRTRGEFLRGSLFVPVAVGDVTYGNCCPIRRRGEVVGLARVSRVHEYYIGRAPAPPRSVDRVKMACYISGLSAYRGLARSFFCSFCSDLYIRT